MTTGDRYNNVNPLDPGVRIEERFREIEQALQQLQNRTLQHAVLPEGSITILNAAGGNRAVLDGAGLRFYDDSGNLVLDLSGSGLSVLDASGVEQVQAGALGGGVYGIEVIRAGVPINLADYVFGAAASSVSGAFESTTSTTYTNLSTDGPSATVTVGSSGKVLVIGGATVEPETSSGPGVIGGILGFAGSGANTIADTDLGYVRHYDAVDAIEEISAAAAGGRILTGLSAGSTTFKLRYKMVSAVTDSVRFGHRWIVAQPL